MKLEHLKRILEAAIFAVGHPLTLDALLKLFSEHKEQPTKEEVKKALECIAKDCESRGVALKQLASGYQFQSKQDYAPWMQHLWEEKAPRYSRALLETLALIAYRQPITRGEIEEVRGVAVSTHIIRTLMEREWVKVVGQKEVPGKPALYGSTKKFLDYFNLKTIKELPKLDAIKDLEEIGKQLNLGIEEKRPESGASENTPAAEMLETPEAVVPDQVIEPGLDVAAVSPESEIASNE